MDDEVETKLSAARTRLILDKPFLGALALRNDFSRQALSPKELNHDDARSTPLLFASPLF